MGEDAIEQYIYKFGQILHCKLRDNRNTMDTRRDETYVSMYLISEQIHIKIIKMWIVCVNNILMSMAQLLITQILIWDVNRYTNEWEDNDEDHLNMDCWSICFHLEMWQTYIIVQLNPVGQTVVSVRTENKVRNQMLAQQIYITITIYMHMQ